MNFDPEINCAVQGIKTMLESHDLPQESEDFFAPLLAAFQPLLAAPWWIGPLRVVAKGDNFFFLQEDSVLLLFSSCPPRLPPPPAQGRQPHPVDLSFLSHLGRAAEVFRQYFLRHEIRHLERQERKIFRAFLSLHIALRGREGEAS